MNINLSVQAKVKIALTIAFLIFVIVYTVFIIKNKLIILNPEKSLKNLIFLAESDENLLKPEIEKYKTNKISEKECEELKVRLYDFMNTNDIYKDPELKIADLAKELNTSSHTLSYLFNQYINISYADFINDYRIILFKNIVKNAGHDKIGRAHV